MDDDSRALSEFFDPPNRAMQVVITFPVGKKRIRASFDKLFQERLRIRDHHVYLERETGHAPERLHDQRTHRNVGDEMPIHHVNVYPVGPSLLHLRHLFTQASEVSRKDRWG
jgi:hypothetical protein